MVQVLRTVDKANGYCFGDLEERNLQAMMSTAVGADFQFDAYPLYHVRLCVCKCVHACMCVEVVTVHNYESISYVFKWTAGYDSSS